MDAPSTPAPSSSTAVTVGPAPASPGTGSCPVTRPAESPSEPPPALREWLRSEGADSQGWFGGGDLWALPATARHGYPDGRGKWSLKIPWWRGHDEPLRIRAVSLKTGKTVDGHAPRGYAAPGFQAGGVDLPHLGCWRITGELGPTRVRFVVDVVPAETTPN
ncbi:hypothetical protein GCM10010156_43250 [Planobispora rosea]|uniref:Uncharacterized protein n=2 Tax=Planobispora rosea TaxID=35762 RepID=A0A8J3WDZ0_PLARO|nr:hypothetical protein GCM10010156_43250 [Planobispora rosea]GIH85820.1 hypothetical protein Pro02_42280 [Planobispora rosea]